jgi:hypothetical protein
VAAFRPWLAFPTRLPKAQFCRPLIALNYAQRAQNINMHTAEDTLPSDFTSSQTAVALRPSIHKQETEGGMKKTYPSPLGVLRR